MSKFFPDEKLNTLKVRYDIICVVYKSVFNTGGLRSC